MREIFMNTNYTNSIGAETASIVIENDDIKLMASASCNSTVAVTIGIVPFLEEIARGCSLQAIAKEIKKTAAQAVEFSKMKNFEYAKEHILPELFNPKISPEKEKYKEAVNRPFLDLYVIYSIRIDNMKMIINQDILKSWGKEEEEIYEISIQNLKRSGFEIGNVATILSSAGLPVPDDEAEGDEEGLHYLSNAETKFGAAVILNEDCRKEIIEKYGEVYIIPSSIHELIFIKRPAGIDKDEIKNTIREVNDTICSPEERLSYELYHLNKDGISIA